MSYPQVVFCHPMLPNVAPSDLALFAITATVLSALVAAVASYTVARVNHRAARRLARENADRDFRMKELSDLMELTAHRTLALTEALIALDLGDNDLFQQRWMGTLSAPISLRVCAYKSAWFRPHPKRHI